MNSDHVIEEAHDNILKLVQDELQLQSVWLVVQIVLVIYFMLWLRNVISNELAWRQFKSSTVLAVGSGVRLCIGNSEYNGVIKYASRRNITIDCGKMDVYLPTKSFPETKWMVLKPVQKLGRYQPSISETIKTDNEDTQGEICVKC